MMACSERHFRINDDLIRIFRLILMESSPNITLIIDYNRTKIAFPNLVPVLVLQFFHLIGNVIAFCFGDQNSLKSLDIQVGSWNISNKTLVLILESIKTKVCQFSYKQILLPFLNIGGCKSNCCILHILSVKNVN